MKGTDQQVSLEVDEFAYMIEVVKNISISLGSGKITKK